MHLKFVDDSDCQIEGMLMPFGGLANGKDLAGEFFSRNTDFCLELYPGPRPLMFHHGLDPQVEAKAVGRIESIEMTDKGGWMRGWLDKRSEFYEAIKEMITQDALELSSGALGHLVRKNAKTGEIKRWPVAEGSLTPTPCCPGLAVVDFAEAKAHFKAVDLGENFEDLKAKLDSQERANLPDSSFAYVDADGNRHLPVNDESHAKDALSRFDQTEFASAEDKAKAARKILAACEKFGVTVADDDPVRMAATKSASIKSMEGSYEDLMEDLSRALNPQSPFGSQAYSYIVATYPAYVIVCRCDYGEDGDTYWKVAYSIGDDGEPILGKAAQVEQTYVPAKSFSSESPLTLDAQSVSRHAQALVARTKGLHERRISEGRVLSVANRVQLTSAKTSLTEAAGTIATLLDATAQAEQDQAKAKALTSPEGLTRRLQALSLLLETLPE